MERKGITPIIAVVLLLMMTVASAGLAWAWLQSMQTSTQEKMEQQVKSIGANPFRVFSVEPLDHDANPATPSIMKLFIKNTEKTTLNGIGAADKLGIKINKRVQAAPTLAGDCLTKATLGANEACALEIQSTSFPALGATTEVGIATVDGYEISYVCTTKSAADGGLYC